MDHLEEAKALFFEGLDYFDAGAFDKAEQCLRKAHRLVPERLSILNNLVATMLRQNRHRFALDYAQKAHELDQDDPLSTYNLANILGHLGDTSRAIELIDTILTTNSGERDPWISKATFLMDQKRHKEALEALHRAQAIDPECSAIWGYIAGSKLALCDWDGLDAVVDRLRHHLDDNPVPIPPFVSLGLDFSNHERQIIASNHARQQWGSLAANNDKYDFNSNGDGRIHIAYFSSDFRIHPTAHLIAGVIGSHDRSKFKLTAVTYGPTEDDAVRQRLRACFDEFLEVNAIEDGAVARHLRDAGVDIAIDLNGYTTHARTGIFYHKPAPVTVNMLGFPGTMGTPIYDYIIADSVVVPVDQRDFFTEHLALMPDSYQMNDQNQNIAAHTPTRSELGLPEDGVVLCCFNNHYKITKPAFDCWMRVLKASPNSVLWLLDATPEIKANLERRAKDAGVDANRLVYAPKIANEGHLARHVCADLFVDCFLYNAHTTASDALRMGVPLVTQAGNTFSSRVAASLLTACGMEGLITNSVQEYETKIMDLVTQPYQLLHYKEMLAKNLDECALIDTQTYTRNLEQLYAKMVERARAGLPTTDLELNCLSNREEVDG